MSADLVFRPAGVPTGVPMPGRHELATIEAQCSLVANRLLPPDHPCARKPEKVLVIALLGRNIGINNPLTACQYIFDIKGRPHIGYLGLKAALELRGYLVAFDESCDEKKATVIGRCPGDPRDWPIRRVTFTMADAVTAGLPARNPNYKTIPKTMLKARALTTWVNENAASVKLGLDQGGFLLAEDPVDLTDAVEISADTPDGEVIDAELVDDTDPALAEFVADWRAACETNDVTPAQSAAVLTKATGGVASKAAGVPAELRADAVHALRLFVEQMGDAA